MIRKSTYRDLKHWRKAHEFGQADAARLLGLSQSFYSRVERQLVSPNPHLAKRIADKTGVPLEEVLGVA